MTPHGFAGIDRFGGGGDDGCCSVHQARGHVLARARGEIDLANAPALAATLEAAAASSQQIVVDLSAVTFLDSSGLSALVRAFDQVRAHDGQMAVVGPVGMVHQTLQISGLDRLFPVRESVEDGVAALVE
jgi:anti-sigma B factor antagonist